MRRTVFLSVVLLLPILFCSCGKKQSSVGKTSDVQEKAEQGENSRKDVSDEFTGKQKNAQDDYQEGSLKVRIPAEEQPVSGEKKITQESNSNVVILDKKSNALETKKDDAKKTLKKSQRHRQKLWTEHQQNSLAARLALKNPDKIIRWNPRLVLAGTSRIRLPDAAVCPDKSLIVFIETTGEAKGPYGSRVIAFDTNTWMIPVLYLLPEKQIYQITFIGNTGKIAAICKGQSELDNKDSLLIFDLLTGETVKSCELSFSASRIVAEPKAGLLYITEINTPDVRIYDPGNLDEPPKTIRSYACDPVITFADNGASIVMASSGMLEFYKASDFRPLSNVRLPEKFTPQEILLCGANTYLIVPSKTAMSEGICVLNGNIRRFGENSAGVLVDSFEPETFFSLMSRKGEIVQFTVPSLETKSSIFPEDIAPKKNGNPIKIFSIPHARCLAVLDANGNFYLLYHDMSGKKWQKELLFSAVTD